ncbi:hypothetical protein BH09PSE6_BH09PSE6_23300 [soil metagenome]
MAKPTTFAESMFGAMGLPGFGGSPAALDPMKGFAVPTVDVDELERRIADLRSVEGWLQTQATMVRTTIQALEVQRNTVMMVKSFGANLPKGAPFFTPAPAAEPAPEPDAAPKPSASKPDPLAAAAGEAAIGNATAWWSLLQDQLNKMTGVTAPAAGARKSTTKPKAAVRRKTSRPPG